jgi:transcriptional regulator with XRE-family HTH domain
LLSARVAEILRDFGLSQNALARLLGVSQSNVHAWLNGGNMPQTTAMAFQTALGVRWQWVLSGEGEMRADGYSVPEDMKELVDLWPRLTDKQRQYLLGVAQGILAADRK